MASTVALVVDGVLRRSVGDGVIPHGSILYHGLKETSRLALLTNDTDIDAVMHWLDVNGFREHPYLLPTRDTDLGDLGERRMRQVQRLREAGCPVDLLVEPDPSISALAIRNGIAVLSFVAPRYSRPYFRPDYDGSIRPWDELTAEVVMQQELRAQDPRPTMEVL